MARVQISPAIMSSVYMSIIPPSTREEASPSLRAPAFALFPLSPCPYPITPTSPFCAMSKERKQKKKLRVLLINCETTKVLLAKPPVEQRARPESNDDNPSSLG